MQNIPIFLSSDNNYAPFVATTIASICDNTDSFCDFYILDGGITKENKDKICDLKDKFNNFSIEFIKIDSQIYFKDIDYKNDCHYVSISTYNRFLIPKIKPNIEKVLYLDVDIIVLGNIKELFNIDLDKFDLAAVPEDFYNQNNYYKINLHQKHKYFNAGVLLINNKNWIKNNLTEEFFKTEQLYRERLRWADQDVLNIVFNNNYLVLDSKFNHMTQKIKEKQDVNIRHFNTNIKPWQISDTEKTNLLPNHQDFWKYAKMTPFYDELHNNCVYKTKLQLRILSMINGN